ncbi:MAG: NAD(P)-dependent alcohol dehydrogenase [Actinobacteria bacterium]|nr:NAD(P)-dependent alcohol dehydrogenase [Actinomycetota bacterium]
MKAQYYERYGRPEEVLELREVPRPIAGPGEVLVRVHATSVQALDWHLVLGEPRIMRLQMGLRPRRHIPGADVAGTVEGVGEGVTRFAVGDVVFGETDGGSLAEYVTASERTLAHKPEGVGFGEAAATPVAGLTALQGLRDWGGFSEGDSVLIIGASGGVGTFAVQIAKSLGAVVTAVCSTHNVETTRSLGAERVIDYTREDFTTGGPYDMILGVAGSTPLLTLRRMLSPQGTYVGIGGGKGGWLDPIPQLLRIKLVSLLGGRRMTFGLARTTSADLEIMAEMLVKGQVRPVIDRNYKLDEGAEAIAYVLEGHARGKVVLTI